MIAQDGEIVGEGATQPPGGSHAEAMALADAGARAQGATCYVTLEPCAHFGRTPPCSDALIAAGVSRVVVAVGDPDPQVAGRGLQQLREAGIEVQIGDGAAEGALHYEAYAHHRRTGRPFVTAKFAASMDGRISATSGDSRWISGPQTLRWAHQNRPLFDAMSGRRGNDHHRQPAADSASRALERPGPAAAPCGARQPRPDAAHEPRLGGSGVLRDPDRLHCCCVVNGVDGCG